MKVARCRFRDFDGRDLSDPAIQSTPARGDSAARAGAEASKGLAAAEAAGASWVQLGDEVLVFAANGNWPHVSDRLASDAARAGSGASFEELGGSWTKSDLHIVVQKGRIFQHACPDVPVLADKGRFLVVAIAPDRVAALASDEPCFAIRPLRPGESIFSLVPRGPASASRLDAAVADGIDRTSFAADLAKLVSYRSRHSLSTDYRAAAQWCRDRLSEVGFATRLETVALNDGETVNVVAERAGSGQERHLVLVTAHLDSINHDAGPDAPAPGADDNGSGSAGVLAMASALSAFDADHDLRIILYGGEEQGLFGSRAHLAALPESERSRIHAVLNMDMIGTRNTPGPTVLLEGGEVSRDMVSALSKAAAAHTGLTVQVSFNPFASDHVPFIEAGIPAVLTIEGADGANDAIHTGADTLDRIDPQLAVEILRMNTAYVASALGVTGAIQPEMPQPNQPAAPAIPSPGGLTMPTPQPTTPAPSAPAFPGMGNAPGGHPTHHHLSGRYTFGGGATGNGGASLARAVVPTQVDLVEPELVEPAPPPGMPRFTLQIDIDGTDPLGVVSGTVLMGTLVSGMVPPHFIGQVTANTVTGAGRSLTVENFALTWPDTGEAVDRVEILVAPRGAEPPQADVTFVTAGGRRKGPYAASRVSPYFRDVEVEVDREDGAVPVEPYDTHLHPDRPADLPREMLTLETAFAKAGIGITRSAMESVVSTAEAGGNSRWNTLELHDAMQLHWSAFSNRAQSKMWIFLAELADDDGLGGIMFDADIGDPGGVDRQGTAVFTKSPYFHTPEGGYPRANPPAQAAAQRELFFNLIHETGHAFNLFHSWQKALETPWSAPSWMPVQSDRNAISWMNYPDQPTPGANATWFYDRFRFTFDANERLFLRHAPERFVQMGNAAWGHGHGRAVRGLVDPRLRMQLRTLKDIFQLGEPVSVELKLENVSDEPVQIHTGFDLADGMVEIAITDPDGNRRPFLPLMHTRSRHGHDVLMPGKAVYHNYPLAYSTLGTPFNKAGAYRIEASYDNHGVMASAVMRIYVSPADPEALPVVHDLFRADVGRTIMMGGTRVMTEALDRMDHAMERLGPKHPAHFKLAEARAGAFAQTVKILDPDTGKVVVAEPEPDIVVRELQEVVKAPEAAANSLGHIAFDAVVSKYTNCAMVSGDKTKARKAQKDLVDLFKSRSVITSVIKQAEDKLKEMS